MRDDRKWWFGLLTLAATPLGVMMFDYYQSLVEGHLIGGGGYRLTLDICANGAVALPLLGAVASLVVLFRAPRWWRLTGVPGLLLNSLWLFLLIAFCPPHGGWFPA